MPKQAMVHKCWNWLPSNIQNKQVLLAFKKTERVWAIVICKKQIPPPRYFSIEKAKKQWPNQWQWASLTSGMSSSLSPLGPGTRSAETKTIPSKPGQSSALQNAARSRSSWGWEWPCGSELRHHDFLKRHFPWKEIRALSAETAISRCERNYGCSK